VLPRLVAALSSGRSWDTAVAIRLMNDADALVERLGVDGNHPEVTAVAEAVVRAHATRNMGTLRFAVAEFGVVVRRLAAARDAPG
jgi:hypothetical protein